MSRIRAILGLRPLSLVAACILTSFAAFSQTHYEGTVALGVKGGVQTSRIMFTPSVKQSFPFGVNAGAMIRYMEEEHFGLIAECNFSQRGWKEDFDTDKYRYTRTLNYLDIPLLAHIYFGGRNRVTLNLGPQVSVLLSESTSANFDPDNTSSLPDFPNTNRQLAQLTLPASGKVDYGITAGIGGEFNLSTRNALSVELRGYFGLNNVLPSGRQDPFRGSNQYSVALTAGYWFRIK